MTNVPELRFDGFDGEWEEKKIKETSNVIGGGTPNTKNTDYWHGDINRFTPAEINDKRYYKDSERKITEIGLNKSSAKLLDKDKTILFTSRATIGSIGILLENSSTNQGFQSLEIRDTVYLDFMYSLCETILNKAIALATGSTFREISKKSLENIEVKIPIFEEQEKIGDLFKKIDNLIEIQEGKVTKVRDYKKSMLQKMFPKKDELVPEFRFDGFDDNYNEAYLLEIGDNIKGSTYSKKDAEEARGNSQLIHYGMMFTEYSSIITESPYTVIEKPNSVKSKVGDLIMPASSTTSDNEIVTASVVAKEGIIYGGDINIIRTNNIDLALYLSYYITGTELKNLIFKNVQGTTIHHLYFSSLENITVKLPSAEEQQKIGQFFKNLDTQIENEKKLLESYKMMKKSLLQKMFV